jgi:hypothetical protein
MAQDRATRQQRAHQTGGEEREERCGGVNGAYLDLRQRAEDLSPHWITLEVLRNTTAGLLQHLSIKRIPRRGRSQAEPAGEERRASLVDIAGREQEGLQWLERRTDRTGRGSRRGEWRAWYM